MYFKLAIFVMKVCFKSAPKMPISVPKMFQIPFYPFICSFLYLSLAERLENVEFKKNKKY